MSKRSIFCHGADCRRSGVNPLATKFELEHYFKIAEPKVIAVDSVLLGNVKHAISKLQTSPEVIVIDDASGRLDTSSQAVVSFSVG